MFKKTNYSDKIISPSFKNNHKL